MGPADVMEAQSNLSQPEVIAERPASPTISDNCSIRSISTATYERQEQEAEELFRKRVELLVQDLWPAPQTFTHRLLTSRLFRSIVPQPQAPLVQHLKGGGFNHITSITLPPSYAGGTYRDLILRIPREEESRPEHQVATLNLIRSRISIPVATVLATDFTSDNAVGKPYVLQQRIPGQDLESVWNDLSHLQRRIVAEEVGRIVRILLSIESSQAGIVQASLRGSELCSESPNIAPWTLEGEILDESDSNNTLPGKATQQQIQSHGEIAEGSEPNSAIPKGYTGTLEFFGSYFGRWRRISLAESDGEIDEQVLLYDQLLTVAREMNDLELFKPDMNCLCHLDLHPRNIMVQLESDISLKVTGILDWDEAIFAPKFVNCQPPGWLWGYDKDTHVNEDDLLPWPYELEGANNQPATLEQQELKRIFEENAGPEYPRLAYDAPSRLIRGMFRLATLGLTANWHVTATEKIIREWKEINPGTRKY